MVSAKKTSLPLTLTTLLSPPLTTFQWVYSLQSKLQRYGYWLTSFLRTLDIRLIRGISIQPHAGRKHGTEQIGLNRWSRLILACVDAPWRPNSMDLLNLSRSTGSTWRVGYVYVELLFQPPTPHEYNRGFPSTEIKWRTEKERGPPGCFALVGHIIRGVQGELRGGIVAHGRGKH